MVQTYQSPVRIYKYPFELVMAAYERRFPTSPLIPIFVGSEIMEEFKSEDGAVHVIERKCKLNVDAPYLLKKIAGVEYVYFMQKNSLDRRNRTLNIDAHNLSFSSRIVIKESCVYYVHQENADWTCFEQSASLDVKSFFGFESTVEKLAMKQYEANIQKGKEIIEHYVNELFKEGKTHFPPFEETVSTISDDSAIFMSKSHETARKLSKDQKEPTPEITIVQSSRSGSMAARRLSSPAAAGEEGGKLETEYIKRFLGVLTPLEESRLCELRYWLHDNCKGKIPNDAHLLRFLRARDFDVNRAREMVTSSMLWRKQHNVDKILSTYQPHPVILQYFPGAWLGHDLNHRPLFVLRLGLVDIKGLLRSVGEEGSVKFILSICEEGLKRTEEATKTFGEPVSAWTMLVDLEGLSMRHLWRPGIRTLLQIIEIVEANYPETMGSVLIVRAPRVFPVLWTLVSPFIDERTREKFMIYGGSDFLTENGGLKDYLDEKVVPDFLDGPCIWRWNEGGHVPKSLYLTTNQDGAESAGQTSGSTSNRTDVAATAGSAPSGAGAERSGSAHQAASGLLLESIYQTGYTYKGLPLEVAEIVTSHGGVLTWDFDVVKGQCEFVLLRTNKIINPQDLPQTSPASALSALSPTGLLAAAGAGHQPSANNPVLFDKSLTLGVDLFIAEKAQYFAEGDSIQGSHVCSESGTYVLQWKFSEPHLSVTQGPHHHSSFDFTLPLVHKCKIMYHFELLDSENFKGSVASLQSCGSSFSSLSVATLNSNGRKARLSPTTTPNFAPTSE